MTWTHWAVLARYGPDVRCVRVVSASTGCTVCVWSQPSWEGSVHPTPAPHLERFQLTKARSQAHVPLGTMDSIDKCALP